MMNSVIKSHINYRSNPLIEKDLIRGYLITYLLDQFHCGRKFVIEGKLCLVYSKLVVTPCRRSINLLTSGGCASNYHKKSLIMIRNVSIEERILDKKLCKFGSHSFMA